MKNQNSDYEPLTDMMKRKNDRRPNHCVGKRRRRVVLLRIIAQWNRFLLKCVRHTSDTVEGAGISLANMGIDTSSNYREHVNWLLKMNKL